MDTFTLVRFVVGLLLLLAGAEALVRGASSLARAVGISPLVVGLTVVAFGTSAPELAVTVQGAMAGAADVSLGNVLGSNVFNVLGVLGISALTAPLVVARQLVRLEVPLMIGATLAVAWLAGDGVLDRGDGALLFGAVLLYTTYAIWRSRAEARAAREAHADEATGEVPAKPWYIQILLILVGLALLVIGADWLVAGAVAVATWLGLSERVIALTLIAAGTSLPEVATSVMASFRGERDIAVGNAIGSNLFNLLTVLGISSLVSPGGIAASGGALSFDLPMALAVATLCLPLFLRAYVVSRLEGALLLFYYAVYVTYLVLRASDHPATEGVVVWFGSGLIPLSALVLVIGAARGVRRRAMAARSGGSA